MGKASSAGLLSLLTAGREYRAGGTGPKATLMVLLESMGNYDGEWSCWPSMASLADQTEQAPGTVRRHVAMFEKRGLITRQARGREGGGRGSNKFVLCVEVLFGAPRQTAHFDHVVAVAGDAGIGDGIGRETGGQTAQGEGGKPRTDAAPERALPAEGLLPRTVERFENGKPSEAGASAAPSKPTDDPLVARAHKLAVLAFEQPVKPVLRGDGKGSPFAATLKLLEQLLRSGVSVQRLEAAIQDGVEVWTLAGVQTAVAKSNPRARKGATDAGTARVLERLNGRPA